MDLRARLPLYMPHFTDLCVHHSAKYGCCYALKCMVDGAISTDCEGVEVHPLPAPTDRRHHQTLIAARTFCSYS